VAPPAVFKTAGLEYGSVVAGVEVSLQRRADGRSYLRLTSSKPVTEPFVDLILEANWANGRITRDYTMLFDPPALRSGGTGMAAAPTAPILSRPLPAAPPAKGIASIPYSSGTSSGAAARPAPTAKAPAASLEKVPSGGDKQVTVKSGDTAGKIAAQNKPASVSLDQMLVALLRSNPDAFIGGNVNRVKSGAVLDIPSAETASAISAGEASQTIVAQSKDFNAFRRKLAEGVPTTQVAGADRQAGGKVQAKVEDRAPASATPDKLTLSKGAVQGKAATSAAEDKIAKERQAKEASTRVAELSKNISDLNKLSGAPSAPAAPAAGTGAAKAPGVAVTAPSGVATPAAPPATPPAAPAAAVSPAPVPAPAASAAAAAPAMPAASSSVPAVAAAPESAASSSVAPMAAASQPAAAASAAAPVAVAPPVVKKKPVAPPPPPEPSLVDELLDNPLTLPIGGGLLLLLAGFGFYRYRQRGSSAQVDSSFLESRLQPDSFFGASGGQRIDTNESNVTGSSLVYSPSQLDAAGDVDPVAEADVYLAYGRDLQAEEILKEAMRTSPTRVAIHAKLMEIYAKRRDSKAFETVAVEAFNLTRGNGPEWAYITEMGRELDPANPMYQPGGQPGGASGAAFNPGGTMSMATQPAPITASAPAAAPSVDVDLDLDFSLGDDEPEAAPAAIAPPPPAAPPIPAPAPAPRAPEPTVAIKPPPAPSMDLNMDFGSATVALPTAAAPAKPAAATEPDASFLSEGLNFTPEPFTPAPKPVVAAKAPPAPAPAPAPAAADNGMLEFDLGALSLDLDGPSTESPAPAAMEASSDGPLETKFLLAEEFRSLGDTDGARSLAEEVLAEASGPLKVKAQAFLNALS
jgi:pilus assembly protein FimV